MISWLEQIDAAKKEQDTSNPEETRRLSSELKEFIFVNGTAYQRRNTDEQGLVVRLIPSSDFMYDESLLNFTWNITKFES